MAYKKGGGNKFRFIDRNKQFQNNSAFFTLAVTLFTAGIFSLLMLRTCGSCSIPSPGSKGLKISPKNDQLSVAINEKFIVAKNDEVKKFTVTVKNGGTNEFEYRWYVNGQLRKFRHPFFYCSAAPTNRREYKVKVYVRNAEEISSDSATLVVLAPGEGEEAQRNVFLAYSLNDESYLKRSTDSRLKDIRDSKKEIRPDKDVAEEDEGMELVDNINEIKGSELSVTIDDRESGASQNEISNTVAINAEDNMTEDSGKEEEPDDDSYTVEDEREEESRNDDEGEGKKSAIDGIVEAFGVIGNIFNNIDKDKKEKGSSSNVVLNRPERTNSRKKTNSKNDYSSNPLIKAKHVGKKTNDGKDLLAYFHFRDSLNGKDSGSNAYNAENIHTVFDEEKNEESQKDTQEDSGKTPNEADVAEEDKNPAVTEGETVREDETLVKEDEEDGKDEPQKEEVEEEIPLQTNSTENSLTNVSTNESSGVDIVDEAGDTEDEDEEEGEVSADEGKKEKTNRVVVSSVGDAEEEWRKLQEEKEKVRKEKGLDKEENTASEEPGKEESIIRPDENKENEEPEIKEDLKEGDSDDLNEKPVAEEKEDKPETNIKPKVDVKPEPAEEELSISVKIREGKQHLGYGEELTLHADVEYNGTKELSYTWSVDFMPVSTAKGNTFVFSKKPYKQTEYMVDVEVSSPELSAFHKVNILVDGPGAKKLEFRNALTKGVSKRLSQVPENARAFVNVNDTLYYLGTDYHFYNAQSGVRAEHLGKTAKSYRFIISRENSVYYVDDNGSFYSAASGMKSPALGKVPSEAQNVIYNPVQDKVFYTDASGAFYSSSSQLEVEHLGTVPADALHLIYDPEKGDAYYLKPDGYFYNCSSGNKESAFGRIETGIAPRHIFYAGGRKVYYAR